MFEIKFDQDAMDKAMEEMITRRKAISGLHVHCPVCETNQVQLVSWMKRLCDMRCRHCKQKFVVDSKV